MRKRQTINAKGGVVFRHQASENDCVPACVKMILDGLLHRKKISYSSIREALGTGPFGTSVWTPRSNFTIADRLNVLFDAQRLPLIARTVFNHKDREAFLAQLIETGIYPFVSIRAGSRMGQMKLLCTKLTDEIEHAVIPVKIDEAEQKIYCIDPLCEKSDGVLPGAIYGKDAPPDKFIKAVDFMTFWDATGRQTNYIMPKSQISTGRTLKQVTITDLETSKSQEGK
ncbi:MAG: hypothetical protein KHF84_04790 [Thermoplasmata archaeon]|nr:hypothetical protein [Candidatus Sysuiplasma jiujiangense]